MTIAELQQLIVSTIYENTNQEISGSDLQNVLLQIKNKLSDGFYIGGIVNRGSIPLKEKNVMYFTEDIGTFSQFGITIPDDGKWHLITWNSALQSYQYTDFCYGTTVIDEFITNINDFLKYTDVVQNVIGTATDKVPSQKAVKDALDSILERLIPSGGTLGQVLAKKSNANYDVEWVTQEDNPITPYTVTNNLDSNVTNSNSSVSVNENTAYIAVLSLDDGYQLDTVSVSVGDVEVTSFVFNTTTGVIYIAAVSGNVVINATATPL